MVSFRKTGDRICNSSSPFEPRRYVKFLGELDKSTAPAEHDLQEASLIRTARKPFDVLVEGLIPQQSRGDTTAIELFAIGFENAKGARVTPAGFRADFEKAFNGQRNRKNRTLRPERAHDSI